MVSIQSDAQDPHVIKEGTPRFAADTQKSQRTEVIVRNTKIEETGRCPFDVHTTLVKGQCCFCVTLVESDATERQIFGGQGITPCSANLLQAYGCHPREFGELRFLQGPLRTSGWRKRKQSLVSRNIMKFSDTTIQVTTYDTVGDC